MKLILSIVPGLIAGVAAGAVGIYLFEWVAGQGFYALIVPGALVGLACGLCSPNDSNLRGVLNAIVALFAGLVAEWRSFPFKVDKSFGYFVGHATDLKPLTLIMLGIGTFVGFWWGRESIRWRRKGPSEPGRAVSAKVPSE